MTAPSPRALVLLIALCALSFCTPFGPGEDPKPDAKKGDDKAAIVAQLPSYPLKNCPVSGEALGSMGDPIDLVVKGRLVRLCCKDCVKSINKDSLAAFKKIDKAVIAAQKPSFPLTHCPVTGDKYDIDAIDKVIGTRYIKLCCKGCKRKLSANPAKYLAEIDKALIKAQLADYPLKNCPVSGEPLGSMGDPIDQLYGTTLVRLCCKGCIKSFEKEPAKYIEKLDAARAKKPAGKSSPKHEKAGKKS